MGLKAEAGHLSFSSDIALTKWQRLQCTHLYLSQLPQAQCTVSGEI